MEKKRSKPKIILTFDLEFWWDNPFLEKYLPRDKNSLPDFTIETTRFLLGLLHQYEIRATFFVVGKLAEKHPELIKDIFKAGHEIASHGYSHSSLRNLNQESFEEEIKLTSQIIKNIIGIAPKGFRAPNFSLNQKTKWALDILKKNGFDYDSSVFPVKTPFYGVSRGPINVHKISGSLTELPLAVYEFVKIRVPIVAGGFYFRVTPVKLYIYLLRKAAKKRTPVVYFHPRDLYNFTPKIKGMPWLNRQTAFYGTASAMKRFEILLKNFEFISIEELFSFHNI